MTLRKCILTQPCNPKLPNITEGIPSQHIIHVHVHAHVHVHPHIATKGLLHPIHVHPQV